MQCVRHSDLHIDLEDEHTCKTSNFKMHAVEKRESKLVLKYTVGLMSEIAMTLPDLAFGDGQNEISYRMLLTPRATQPTGRRRPLSYFSPEIHKSTWKRERCCRKDFRYPEARPAQKGGLRSTSSKSNEESEEYDAIFDQLFSTERLQSGDQSAEAGLPESLCHTKRAHPCLVQTMQSYPTPTLGTGQGLVSQHPWDGNAGNVARLSSASTNPKICRSTAWYFLKKK